MRSARLTLGRRFVVVLEPGEEVVSTLTAWAAGEGIDSATVDVFFGAFRGIRLIASHEPIADPEPPLRAEVLVEYAEGLGSGSLSSVDGAVRVHLHVAAGAKGAGGLAYAGHLLSAETHYTVELVVQEVLSPRFEARPDPRAYGLASLHFAL